MSERGLEEDEGEELVSSGDQSTDQKRGSIKDKINDYGEGDMFGILLDLYKLWMVPEQQLVFGQSQVTSGLIERVLFGPPALGPDGIEWPTARLLTDAVCLTSPLPTDLVKYVTCEQTCS